jgi:hypothetical protein
VLTILLLASSGLLHLHHGPTLLHKVPPETSLISYFEALITQPFEPLFTDADTSINSGSLKRIGD